MRTEGQVKQKLKQVLFRHLKRVLAEGLKQVPENCLYNRQPSKFPRMSPIDGLPRVCIHAERAGAVCDISHEKSLDFKGCPFFTPAKSKELLKQDFVRLARSPRDVVAETMPDVAALMWVLDQETGVPASEAESAADGDGSDGEEEPAPEEPATVEAHRVTAPVFEMGVEEVPLQALSFERLDMVERRPIPKWAFWHWPVWTARFWPWNWGRQPERPLDAPVCSPGVDG